MKKFVVILSALALAACSGTQDLGRGKTGKSASVVAASYDQVWNAAIAAIKGTSGDQALEIEKNLTITKEDKARGEITAATGMSMLSFGEVVGVYITPAYDAPKYTIEVESLSKMKTNVFANNWEDELLVAIRHNIAATASRYAPQPAPSQPMISTPVIGR
jgi:hypothetical protein